MPSVPRYHNILNTCSSLLEVKQIHGQIVTCGHSLNLALCTKLVYLASAVAPSMEYAHNIFDRIPQPDSFVHNTLIRGYSERCPCEAVFNIYKKMHTSRLPPDNFTFPFVVRSCAVLSLLREGKQVHCIIVKFGFDSDIFVQCSLVSMYSQTGETSGFESVFGEMHMLNVVSWTAMVSGYAQNGMFSKALDVFKCMISSGTKPNSVTLASLLPACAGLELLKFGEQIHNYGTKLGLDSDISLVNALITLYGKCKNLAKAGFLFGSMKKRNLVSCNAMIGAYEQSQCGDKATGLFREMLIENVKFDYITLVSVISACAREGALDTGRWVHEIARREGLDTNISVACALLDMYSKCGNLESARNVFDELPKRSIVPCSTMIGAYANNGHAEDALKLFSEMQREGLRPNSFTFTSILTACRHSGRTEEGIKHFNSMCEDYSLVPDIGHYTSVVDLLGRAGRLSEAYTFIQRMRVEPEPGVWGAFLEACLMHGNVDLAEHALKHLAKLDKCWSVTYGVLMSNIYAEAGRWDGAMKMRKFMEESGLRKTPARSLVEINLGCTHDPVKPQDHVVA